MNLPFLDDLNDAQRKAVLTTEGAVIVLAGAGSGKTKTITHRIAHLVRNRGVDPASVLAVTFTNKAAAEMKERVIGLVGRDAGERAVISTFHSLGVRILREYGTRLGYRPGFSIYSESDQAGLIREVIREIMPGRKVDIRAVMGVISRAKNDFVTPERFAPLSFREHELHAAAIYPRYQHRLKGCNSLDFDDIIMLSVALLEQHPDVLSVLSGRFRYLMVDEYQDTNRAQYRFVSLLAGQGGNLCVVGDDDQSIYGWRGADAGRILAFEQEHPGCTVITLERNYRSDRVILDAANALIGNNRVRKGKRLWTDHCSGSKVDLLVCSDEEDEARRVIDRIMMEVARGRRYGDCAILYRTNAQSRTFEERLRMEGIPYVLIGGQQFYERKEVRDSLAYLRLMVNPWDEQSLLRVVNFPRRGIGDATLIAVNRWALDHDLPLFDAYGQADRIGELQPASRDRILSFHRLVLEERKRLAGTAPLAPRVHQLFSRLGIYEEMEKISPDRQSAMRRRENIDQIVSALARYEEDEANPTLAGFLDRVSLFDEDRVRDREVNGDEDAVILMSLHSSKGLEFPVVCLAGVEEELLPHRNSMEDPMMVEEERRLLYVGITRARQKLIMSYASRRKKLARLESREPSRFIAEIPSHLLSLEGPSAVETISEHEKRERAAQTFDRLRSLLGG